MAKNIQTMANHLLILLACVLFAVLTEAHGHDNDDVPLTFVDGAVEKGAVCMDGSPAGYQHATGSGDGVNNWIVFLMGGGWCGTYCRDRYTGGGQYYLGSTKNITVDHFDGILTSNPSINPDFYNWNRVYVRYCDGSFFHGDTEVYDRKVNATLQFRGSKIFNAVIDELLAKGMKDANNVILTGASAGGLATMLHCDGFRALLPSASRVKCISDSGFFLHGKDISGAKAREGEYADVVKFHNLTSFLPISCTSRMDAHLCIFGENLVGDIKTPLFLLNSAFDLFEIQVQLKVEDASLKPGWANCVKNPNAINCTSGQMQLIKDFRNKYIEALKSLPQNPSRGLFINSCFNHVLTVNNNMWTSDGPFKLGNKTISQAIGDWYFDRSLIQLIDTQSDFALYCPL